MGFGDELIGSGLARGAAARGKRIAFGFDGVIRWRREAWDIYRGNPNVAFPGSDRDRGLEWIPHCQGSRLYTYGIVDGIWRFRPFRPVPGEMFLTAEEQEYGRRLGSGFAIIEPNSKPQYPNKRWLLERFAAVAAALLSKKIPVIQFVYGHVPHYGGLMPGFRRVPGATMVRPPSFRHALALMANASIYIGPEGGLHHGAAAMGTPAVVIFGGWADPASTGYDLPHHVNLTGGASPCGKVDPCSHCDAAMRAISVVDVMNAAIPLIATRRPGIIVRQQLGRHHDRPGVLDPQQC